MEIFLYAGIIGQYMGIQPEPQSQMDRRALLTDREREVLRGDADDVQDLDQYQSKIRSRLKRRAARLEADMTLLQDVAPAIADDLHERICADHEVRLAKLEARVAELEQEDDGGNN